MSDETLRPEPDPEPALAGPNSSNAFVALASEIHAAIDAYLRKKESLVVAAAAQGLVHWYGGGFSGWRSEISFSPWPGRREDAIIGVLWRTQRMKRAPRRIDVGSAALLPHAVTAFQRGYCRHIKELDVFEERPYGAMLPLAMAHLLAGALESNSLPSLSALGIGFGSLGAFRCCSGHWQAAAARPAYARWTSQ